MANNDYLIWKDKEPNLYEFFKNFKTLTEEVLGDVNQPNIMSHNFEGHVCIRVLNEEDEEMTYRIVNINADLMGGCGCWMGLTIELIKEKE